MIVQCLLDKVFLSYLIGDLRDDDTEFSVLDLLDLRFTAHGDPESYLRMVEFGLTPKQIFSSDVSPKKKDVNKIVDFCLHLLL